MKEHGKVLLGLCLALVPLGSRTADEPAPGTPPSWFAEHLEMMVADGGRWIADNAAYRSDHEPAGPDCTVGAWVLLSTLPGN